MTDRLYTRDLALAGDIRVQQVGVRVFALPFWEQQGLLHPSHRALAG